MSVQILYSPGYGSGWSSTQGSEAQERFLLTYPGFIRALELQEAHDAAKDGFERDFYRIFHSRSARPMRMEMLEACLRAEEVVPERLRGYITADYFADCAYEIVLAFPQFVEDWKAQFPDPEDFPWLGGLHQLKVYHFDGDLSEVRIKAFDGSESVRRRSGRECWD